jgi:hypothetical protein
MIWIIIVLIGILITCYICKKEKVDISICDFEITKPKFRKEGKKEFATFSVLVDDNHRFFIDFPILFKFYSNSKFKSKIKISYCTPDSENNEEIYNKDVFFDGSQVKEYTYYISDIIIGNITIEIETEVDYGTPMISFEILTNNTCKLKKEYRLEIKFPHF